MNDGQTTLADVPKVLLHDYFQMLISFLITFVEVFIEALRPKFQY